MAVRWSWAGRGFRKFRGRAGRWRFEAGESVHGVPSSRSQSRGPRCTLRGSCDRREGKGTHQDVPQQPVALALVGQGRGFLGRSMLSFGVHGEGYETHTTLCIRCYTW